jgi:hypothetical protein
MAANRTARNEAWIASVVLHVGLVAGVIAVAGRPRPTDAGPVVVRTRDTGHEIGVVVLDTPPVRVLPVPLPETPTTPPPVQPPPMPPAVGPIKTVGHQETVAGRRVGSPASMNPPVAEVPSVAGSPPGSPNTPFSPAANPPAAPATGSPNAVVAVAPNRDPPLPAGAATAFFGVPAVGTSVVFVLDRSASMGLDGRLDRARRELAASLRRLPSSTRFQVVAYNRAAEPLHLPGSFGLVPATPDNVAAAIAATDELKAEGSSEHLKALTAALALGPDVVYFLTDEDDLEARDVRTVTQRNHNRVVIHALCLVPPDGGETPMRALARDNRGSFAVVK